MSIRPIDLNGMIQRTDYVGSVKHQEDSKPLVDQQNIQAQVAKQEDAVRHQVTQYEDSSGAKNQADARDEGKGKYFAREGADKKKSKKESGQDRVVRKQPGGSFDIKI